MNGKINENKLVNKLLEEEQKGFEGWDFSYLNNRIEEDELPWEYKTFIEQYLKDDSQLLDMGTGGGEFLLTLNHPYNNTFVTEQYPPNIELCKERLTPLGISVNGVNDDSKLPFDSEKFDLVINRHESFDADEVKRTLKKDGIFITQQVGMNNNLEFSRYLLSEEEKIPQYKNNLAEDAKALEKVGFEIIYKNECYPKLKFFDIGAIVYFAKIIEWEFEGFSVEKCLDKLLLLNEEIKKNGYVESIEHRYIIVGKKK